MRDGPYIRIRTTYWLRILSLARQLRKQTSARSEGTRARNEPVEEQMRYQGRAYILEHASLCMQPSICLTLCQVTLEANQQRTILAEWYEDNRSGCVSHIPRYPMRSTDTEDKTERCSSSTMPCSASAAPCMNAARLSYQIPRCRTSMGLQLQLIFIYVIVFVDHS